MKCGGDGVKSAGLCAGALEKLGFDVDRLSSVDIEKGDRVGGNGNIVVVTNSESAQFKTTVKPDGSVFEEAEYRSPLDIKTPRFQKNELLDAKKVEEARVCIEMQSSAANRKE